MYYYLLLLYLINIFSTKCTTQSDLSVAKLRYLYIGVLVSYSLREENKLSPDATLWSVHIGVSWTLNQSAFSDAGDKEQEIHLFLIQIKEKVAAHGAQ